MSEVGNLDEARAKRDASEKARANRERSECLAAVRSKIGRLIVKGFEPNNIAAAFFLATAEIAIRGGMGDADVGDALREAIAFVRLQLGPAQPSAPTPVPPPA